MNKLNEKTPLSIRIDDSLFFRLESYQKTKALNLFSHLHGRYSRSFAVRDLLLFSIQHFEKLHDIDPLDSAAKKTTQKIIQNRDDKIKQRKLHIQVPTWLLNRLVNVGLAIDPEATTTKTTKLLLEYALDQLLSDLLKKTNSLQFQ